MPPPTWMAGIDVGTTSVRTVLFDREGRQVGSASRRQQTFSRRPGWVEQDPEELYRLVGETLRTALRTRGARRGRLGSVGVTNQRESVVALDLRTGRPLAPAIIWQDTRTAPLAAALSRGGWGARVWDEGGLPLTTYPSAPKMRWLLEHDPKVAGAAARGDLRMGTVDSWIVYRLRGGRATHAPWTTDASNASRTLLYGLRRGAWDPALLDHFAIDEEMLAEVRPSFGPVYGSTAGGLGVPAGVPVGADLGDQQAGLLGVAGGARRSAKLTLGTGAFFLAEADDRRSARRHGLIRTVLWQEGGGRPVLGLEGGVGTVGAFLERLCDGGLGWFSDVRELERKAMMFRGSPRAMMVPAFGGLFAPHWDMGARGSLVGLDLTTGAAEVARSAFDGVAHRIVDVLERYRDAVGIPPTPLWTDGGWSRSRFLIQRVADLSGVPLWQHPEVEATARGAALAAGLGSGEFARLSELPREDPRTVRPVCPCGRPEDRTHERERWKRVVERSRAGR